SRISHASTSSCNRLYEKSGLARMDTKEIADGVVGGKAADTQQGVQGAILAQQAGMGKAPGSGQHGEQKGRFCLSLSGSFNCRPSGAPTPFVWKASADVILDKVRRCKELTRTGD
ncbi:MAG: hypothetical protein ACP5M4_16185, partial [Acidobacteriaceae bacterium]